MLRYGFELLYDDLAEEFVKGDTVVTKKEGMYVLNVLSMYDGLLCTGHLQVEAVLDGKFLNV